MQKPNILIFMSDDQGPWAMHCAGTPELRTPNLDRLAAEGTRFDNFFCASPVCSPARASFLTGRIPSQHGVHDWIRHGNFKGCGPLPDETRTEYLEGLTGFTDVLAANGYGCAFSGKWHLGASDAPQKSHDFMPTLLDYLGFDSPVADQLPGRSFARVLHGEPLNRKDEAVVICDEYAPNRMLRTTDWKYIHRYPDGPNELYHLAEDPGEQVNLVNDPQHAEQRGAMQARLDRWFETYVYPELDGAELLTCRGRGQLDLVINGPKGTTVFQPRDDV